jgi:F0F1-type ATP synthase assembly protein I
MPSGCLSAPARAILPWPGLWRPGFLEATPLDKKNFGIIKALGLFTQLGASMAICVAIGVLVGGFLDRVLNTSPWMLLVFAIFGSGAAIKVMIELVKNVQ